MQSLILASLVVLSVAGPIGQWQQADPQDDMILGYAWDAAAGEINVGREGRYMVPKEVTSARMQETPTGTKYELEALFQEAWCSTMDGNTLEEICESMCPLYFGGDQAVYVVTVVENSNGDLSTTYEKIKDVPNPEMDF